MDQGVLVGVALDVALLAEGVDRNSARVMGSSISGVALLAEGVDRNGLSGIRLTYGNRSPSSRRAWIEIYRVQPLIAQVGGSPSSRRAWIEIA